MRESFVFHAEYLEDIPLEFQDIWLRYIYDYGIFAKVPELSGFEKSTWLKVQRRIDDDQALYDKKTQNLKQNKSQNSKNTEENFKKVSDTDKKNKILSVTEENLKNVSDTDSVEKKIVGAPITLFKKVSGGVYDSVYVSDNVSDSVSDDENVVVVNEALDSDSENETISEYGANFNNFESFDVKQYLQELFKTEQPFTNDFETTATTFFQNKKILENSKRQEYMQFIYDFAKAKCSKNKALDLRGFYYKHFCDEDIFSAFLEKQNHKILALNQRNDEIKICPVCQTKTDFYNTEFLYCPTCKLPIDDFTNKNQIAKFSKLNLLPEKQKQDYFDEEVELKKDMFIKRLSQEEILFLQNELDKKYGLMD